MSDKPVFEFKKLENGKCAFIMKSTDIERTEVISEAYVKEHYNELLRQRNDMMQNLAKANRETETNKVDKNIELEHFIELANMAAKYKKYMDAQSTVTATLALLDNINESIKKIETVLPEVKRQKK